MFERYTESARRALFFARYEVSELGASAIETEHLLLGLTRASEGLLAQVLAEAHVSPESIRAEVASRSASEAKIPTAVEIPFSGETLRALRFAAEEADALGHQYIGTEHLLLGLLREEGSAAASILARKGLRLEDVRDTIVKPGDEPPGGWLEPPGGWLASRRARVSEQIEQIKQSVEQLAGMSPRHSESHALAARIRESLDDLRRLFDG